MPRSFTANVLYDYIVQVAKQSLNLTSRLTKHDIFENAVQVHAPQTQISSNSQEFQIRDALKRGITLTVAKSAFSSRPVSSTSASASLSLDAMSSKATNVQVRQ